MRRRGRRRGGCIPGAPASPGGRGQRTEPARAPGARLRCFIPGRVGPGHVRPVVGLPPPNRSSCRSQDAILVECPAHVTSRHVPVRGSNRFLSSSPQHSALPDWPCFDTSDKRSPHPRDLPGRHQDPSRPESHHHPLRSCSRQPEASQQSSSEPLSPTRTDGDTRHRTAPAPAPGRATMLASTLKPRGIPGRRGRISQARRLLMSRAITRDSTRETERFTVASGSSGSLTVECVSPHHPGPSPVERRPNARHARGYLTCTLPLPWSQLKQSKHSLTLSRQHSLYNSRALSSPTSPVVVYLPPTGSHLQSTHPPIPSYLFSTSAALLSINYRWYLPPSSSPDHAPGTHRAPSSQPRLGRHPFPVPLHDMLHAYEFLLGILLPRCSPTAPATEPREPRRDSVYAPPPPPQRPILIYGSFLSGGLATSLALTESFVSKSRPTRIVGLITRNAVFDWTGVVTSPPPEATSPSPSSPAPSHIPGTETADRNEGEDAAPGGTEWQAQSWTSATLHALKTHLFTSPTSGFDPFVSPTQFLKTAGLAIPASWPESSPSPTTSSSPSSEARRRSKSEPISSVGDHDRKLDPSAHPEEPAAEAASREAGPRLSDLHIDPPSRPAHLKFPPATSGLQIPPALFIYTTTAPFTLPSPPPPPSASPSGSSSPAPAEFQNPATQERRPGRTRPSKPKRNPKPRPKPPSPSAQSEPQSQADNLASLLRRSVFTHEFSSRRIWDEDLDAVAASEARVRVLGVAERDQERGRDGKAEGREGQQGEGTAEGERGEEEKAVREWIENVLH
ncbi:unnamed protein product [Diplocarpon coronariae]